MFGIKIIASHRAAKRTKKLVSGSSCDIPSWGASVASLMDVGDSVAVMVACLYLDMRRLSHILRQ